MREESPSENSPGLSGECDIANGNQESCRPFILPYSYPVTSDSKRFHLLGVNLKEFTRSAWFVFTQPKDEMRDEWVKALQQTDSEIARLIQNGVGTLLGPDIESPEAWLLKLNRTLSSVRYDAEQNRRPDDLRARLKRLDETVAELASVRRLRMIRQNSVPTLSSTELRAIDLNALRNEWYAFTDRSEWLSASVESLFEAGNATAELIEHPAATVLEILSQRREPAVAECWHRICDHYREARTLLKSIRARLRYGHVELIDVPLVLRKELTARWKTVQDLWQHHFADDGIIDNAEVLQIWCNTGLKRVSRDLMGYESQGETVFDRSLILPALSRSPAGNSPPAATENSSDATRMKRSPGTTDQKDVEADDNVASSDRANVSLRREGETVESAMMRIFTNKRTSTACVSWVQREWAAKLKCTAGFIGQTKTWQAILQERERLRQQRK